MHSRRYLFSVTVFLALAAGTAMAHHSAVVFDEAASVQKTGTVTQFIYRNPHLIITLEVNDDAGNPEVWKIEGQSIAAMRESGFDRESL